MIRNVFFFFSFWVFDRLASFLFFFAALGNMGYLSMTDCTGAGRLWIGLRKLLKDRYSYLVLNSRKCLGMRSIWFIFYISIHIYQWRRRLLMGLMI